MVKYNYMSLKEKVTDFIPGYNKLVLPYHFLKAEIAGIRYGFPGKKLTVIGVTGTNGKTSTSFMIWKMLNHAGFKTGLLTTIGWGDFKDFHAQVEHMTTADSSTLNKRIKKIADSGAKFLVLEVTSHAMVQFRTLGIPIEIAVMTNVTHEHLDYHKTFENYRKAKMKLFKKAKFGVINADDPSSAYFTGAISESLTYGIKRGGLKASNVKLSASGVSYDIKGISVKRSERAVENRDNLEYKASDFKIETQIPGEFMVYNSLAATAVGLRLGLTETEIHDGILALESVEGRMNRINLGQNFEAIVDYAHTPDAFQKVFDSVYPNKNGRIISLFGGAGRRDETTRDERGEIAGKYSDICIITEDDSRDEKPEAIANMFLVGCERAGKKLDKDVFIDLDRKSAIEKAIKMAKKGDIVLILGKGHEKTILRKKGPVPFEDLKETGKAIKKILK